MVFLYKSLRELFYLCKKLKIELILIDDLDARDVAAHLDLKPVGTIGIIIRNYRDKKINQTTAIDILYDIYKNSSLFITKELVDYAVKEIKTFSEHFYNNY